EREIVKSFSFKLRQQRSLERVFERRIDHVGAVFKHRSDETKKARLGIVLVNETVSRWRIDRLDDFANLVDVDLVWKLRPENDARGRKVAPDGARGFHAREFWHLDVEDADVGFLAKRKLDSLFAVFGFEHGDVRGKLFFEYLA